jgi:hypothetical protein
MKGEEQLPEKLFLRQSLDVLTNAVTFRGKEAVVTTTRVWPFLNAKKYQLAERTGNEANHTTEVPKSGKSGVYS